MKHLAETYKILNTMYDRFEKELVNNTYLFRSRLVVVTSFNYIDEVVEICYYDNKNDRVIKSQSYVVSIEEFFKKATKWNGEN